MLVVADGGGTVALGELFPVRAVDHRDVGEDGERGAERLIQGDLLRRVRDVIGPAQHVGDAHVEVVHDHGVVVERRAVGAEDHEVLDVFALEADGAVDGVVPGDLALGDAQPDRALVRVRFPFGEQLIGDFLMPLESRALKHRLLVPVEAEPGEAVEDDAGVLVRGAFLVGVFDAEQELAARVAGEEPVEEGGAGAADVEVARGRRREPEARTGCPL